MLKNSPFILFTNCLTFLPYVPLTVKINHHCSNTPISDPTPFLVPPEFNFLNVFFGQKQTSYDDMSDAFRLSSNGYKIY